MVGRQLQAVRQLSQSPAAKTARGANWATEKVKVQHGQVERRRPVSQFRVPQTRVAQPRQMRPSGLVSFRPTD